MMNKIKIKIKIKQKIKQKIIQKIKLMRYKYEK